jgi:rod shape determining protein RodA
MIDDTLAGLRHRLATLWRRPRLDLPLFGALLLLMGIGLLTLYSASDLDRSQVLAQGLRFALGLALMLMIARIPPQALRNWTPWLYAASVALLALVALLGEGRGAHRWLDLGVLRFQPSELLKLTMPMMVAWYLNGRPLPPGWGTLGVVAVLIAIPAGFIAEQPDLGTALLIAASGAFGVFLPGIPWWRIALICGRCVANLFGDGEPREHA